MKYNSEQVKSDLILTIAIMTLLFVICVVLYSDVFKHDAQMDINTSINLYGGNDILSQELQKKIPYVETKDNKYLTAYQNGTATINNIHNDILLDIAYNLLDFNSKSEDYIAKIKELYLDNFFIINKSFNVNGTDTCIFNQSNTEYTCDKEIYNGIKYKAIREIKNINIIDDKAYLFENILFYSTEIINGTTYYKIYDNGLYTNIVEAFTSLDLKRSGSTFDAYINNFLDNKVNYKSTFIKIDDNYKWTGTEIQ